MPIVNLIFSLGWSLFFFSITKNAFLFVQIHNFSSPLYSGNVTGFVDSSWGVSGQGGGARKSNPYLTIKSYKPSSDSYRDSAIERCKDVQVIIEYYM